MKLAVRVIPGAQKTEVVGLMGNGVLKVRVQATPEKGKANQALVTYIASVLGVPREQVSVIRGKTSKDKILGLPEVSLEPLGIKS